MATQVQRRKGTTVQHSTFTGASAELTVDTTKNTVVVHDGATAGGIPLAKESGSALSPSSLSLPNGTANAVPYLNGSKVLTTGSALQFNGTDFGLGGTPVSVGVAGMPAYAALSATSGRSGAFYWQDTGANNVAYSYFFGSVFQFGTATNHPVAFMQSGSEQMRLTSTGLGIGTSSPTAKLTLNGNQSFVEKTAAYLGVDIATSSGNGGNFTVKAGNGSGAGNTSGNLYLGAGRGGASATNGAIYFGVAQSTNTVGLADTLMTLDSSGNLGLGVTPSAWRSTYKASQVGNATAVVGRTDNNNNYFSSNWYVNASNQDIYQNTGFATLYSQGTGTHAWYTAPSGTAGNAISFTQAMTLDASSFLTVVGGATIQGLTVGRGAGAVATNTAVGASALAANTTGNYNVAIGATSLFSNTTADSNVAVGFQSLYTNTGFSSTAVGTEALKYNTTGNANTAIGGRFYGTSFAALNLNTTGAYNVGVGTGALGNNTTASNNTAVGYQAGYNITGAGANNLCIGYVSGTDAVRNITTNSNEIVIGNNSNTAAYIKVSWTVTSDARDKTSFAPVPHGLAFINSLMPTAYQFRVSREDETATGPIRYGFKAQDILAAEGANTVIIDNSDPENLKYNQDSMIAVLVNAVNELTQRLAALEAA